MAILISLSCTAETSAAGRCRQLGGTSLNETSSQRCWKVLQLELRMQGWMGAKLGYTVLGIYFDLLSKHFEGLCLLPYIRACEVIINIWLCAQVVTGGRYSAALNDLLSQWLIIWWLNCLYLGIISEWIAKENSKITLLLRIQSRMLFNCNLLSYALFGKGFEISNALGSI